LFNSPHLLYLHGFLSSPQSVKAQQTASYCSEIGFEDGFTFPMMRNGPAQTVAELSQLIESKSNADIVLMGSSLGGFYATYLSQKYDLPAVLINPAVRPFELWEEHIGEHRNYYTDEIQTVSREHIDELKGIDVEALKEPENFLVLVQTGDETLDYNQAVEKFSDANCLVRQGGNHSYENYLEELPLIFEFLLSRIKINAR
jgi:predicted esterase YcpF (UPF0227 family)